jgi:hypothetical protein
VVSSVLRDGLEAVAADERREDGGVDLVRHERHAANAHHRLDAAGVQGLGGVETRNEIKLGPV